MKVQQDMQSQLKAIRLEHKGKSSSNLSTATEELQFLMDFNSSICQAMAKSMEHLTDSVFVNMANVTLLRRDLYLAYLKAGIKADTLAALRTAPLHISTLFPDTALKQAEEDISNADKGRSGSVYKKGRYHPYVRQDSKSDNRRQNRPAWKNISRGHNKRSKGKTYTGPLAEPCLRQLMSLIGLLTATEKQVHLGRLHMRPIQFHLKNNWRVPESLEKVIPIPRSLHPHLQWWLLEDNVLTGQPLHPIKHALQIFTDASKEGWGTHLNERTARGSWSLLESKLHINYLELKAVFLALSRLGQTILFEWSLLQEVF